VGRGGSVVSSVKTNPLFGLEFVRQSDIEYETM